MIEPPLSPDEPQRLRALRSLKVVHTPLEERFERITRLAQRLLHTPISAISLVESDYQWFKSIQGISIVQTGRAESFCGHAILSDETMVIPDARLDPRFSDNPLVTGEPRIVFYAGHPIRSGEGSNVATLCIIDRVPRSLLPDELEVLRDLAALAEVELNMSMQSLAQRELLAELEAINRKAQIDELTRIWNRASILEILELAHARARRDTKPACAIMADIDHFKILNDTHGHAAGDEVLRQAAKRLLGAIRESDEVGRLGGEEFLVVLGGAQSAQQSIATANRICKAFADKPFRTKYGTFSVTISLGLALAHDPERTDQDQLLSEADKAMYRAKNEGRNRVEIAHIRPDTKARARPAA